MSISKDFYPVGVRIRFLRRVTALVLGGGLLLGLPGGASGQSESAAGTDGTATHVHGVKCLTPLILALSEGGESGDPRWHQLFESITGFDALSSDMVRGAISGQHALEMLSSELAQDLLQYGSPAGKFIIEYTTEGSTAVPTADLNANGIPDYVERAAEYADFSHFALVDSLGFVDPRVNGAPMQIRFVAGTSYGFYNYGTQPNILFIHKDFVGFPSNRDPDGNQLGALKVTIAHELKHAIQFRTNGFVGDAGSANWAELDATMTEEVVYPMVKDYLNYLNSTVSLFRGTQPAIPGAYDQATFGLFYHEYFGPTFWTAVWNRIRVSPRMRMFDAIAMEVQSRGEDPRREYLRNIAWHMASGNRTRPGIGFASAALYPSRTAGGLSFAEQKLPGVTAQVTMNANSVRFYEITASAQWNGRVAVALLRENTAVGAGILLFKRNGSLELQFLEEVTPGGLDALVTGINWYETDRVGLVLANMGTSTVRTQLAYGGADSPQTSGTLPPGLFRYGDLQRDGQVSLIDAEQFVTEFMTRNGPFAATTLDLVRRPAHDLSGNGTITPFDAAFLLSRLRGNPAPFPADVAGDGWFYRFADFRQYQPPAAAMTAQLDANQSASMSGTVITNTPFLTTRFTVGDTPDNDTLSIYLEVSAEAAFRGAYFDVRYDTTLIGLATAKFLPTPDKMPASGITAETTVIPAHMLDWDETALGLRLTLISASPNISGTFLRLQFQPKKDTLVSVRFPRVYLDELPEITQTSTIDARVRPKEGVSIELPGTLPRQTALLGNYPNPFNPSTTIVFRLGEATHTRVSVYDVTGRLVATLQNGVLSGGEHALRFDAENLASGVYIVRLETTQAYTAKMLLVK
jgi:hypothetical protein